MMMNRVRVLFVLMMVWDCGWRAGRFRMGGRNRYSFELLRCGRARCMEVEAAW